MSNVSTPVKMTAAILANKGCKTAIIREMNDAGYIEAFPKCGPAQELIDMYILFFIPAEENPINNIMFNNIDSSEHKYFYYVAPKEIRQLTEKEGIRRYYCDNILFGSRPLLKYGQGNLDLYVSTSKDNAEFNCVLYKLRITPELLNTYTFYEDEETGYYYAKNIIDPRFITSVKDIE